MVGVAGLVCAFGDSTAATATLFLFRIAILCDNLDITGTMTSCAPIQRMRYENDGLETGTTAPWYRIFLKFRKVIVSVDNSLGFRRFSFRLDGGHDMKAQAEMICSLDPFGAPVIADMVRYSL